LQRLPSGPTQRVIFCLKILAILSCPPCLAPFVRAGRCGPLTALPPYVNIGIVSNIYTPGEVHTMSAVPIEPVIDLEPALRLLDAAARYLAETAGGCSARLTEIVVRYETRAGLPRQDTLPVALRLRVGPRPRRVSFAELIRQALAVAESPLKAVTR
jgi:hypothetical protein